MKHRAIIILAFTFLFLFQNVHSQDFLHEPKADRDARMEWWRDARFGLFIHWGLYSIPAGEWDSKYDYGEWIRNSAHIPVEQYDKFVDQFNPVKFDPQEWVRMAKDAGMKYIVITSKHHDGFCLFDTKYTDFNVMHTPFKRDILKELSDACHKDSITMCFYHSIMDWHEPDYLPRRDWETNRSTEGANFDRYVLHMKNQLKELLTNYGNIGVLWFDGEWESTWNAKYGNDLYNYVRSLQPNIIINNRVGAGRTGMEGMNKEGEFSGDYGTPEQEIPATGLPDVDWETCMTMNDHWGYNKTDLDFKSSKELLRNLADIVSKGGNFLLNVGPTAEGVFPQTSIQRLKDIGRWMHVNSDAIYGTKASPFKQLAWGRCTQKQTGNTTRLYLHVFDWPANGKLVIPGILNDPKTAYLLADAGKSHLTVSRQEDALVIDIPTESPDSINSIVVLDVAGKPDISNPPKISADFDIFTDETNLSVTSDRENVELHYTLDGSIPNADSKLVTAPIHILNSTIVSARCFRNGKPVSSSTDMKFTKVAPHPAFVVQELSAGIKYSYYEGDWDSLPNFKSMEAVKEGVLPNFDLSPKLKPEYFGIEYNGYIKIPKDGVYGFYLGSDDGSRLYIDNSLAVDNDGLHGMNEQTGVVPLAAGMHSVRIGFFQKTGGIGLSLLYKGPGIEKQPIPGEILFYKK